MADAVLDTYALMAYLRDEPGAGHVRELLERANAGECALHMSEVNYAETKYMTVRKLGAREWHRVARYLPSLPIHFHSVNRVQADTAAELKAKHAISLADAFAAALALLLSADLVTGDPEFRCLENALSIQWIGR